MGRVIPINTDAADLPRMMELERAGGYQVVQQASYDLDLIVQYGGTVGGFRRHLLVELGGFAEDVLAEDTDLTYHLYRRGYQVAYANRAECYEEAPETFEARFAQVRRWACGHTQVLCRHLWPLVVSHHLTAMQKIDGVMLLCVYLVAPLLLVGQLCALFLFLTGHVPLIGSILLSLFLVIYNAFGNFAPFFQVAVAGMLDGMRRQLYLTPLMLFLFVYNAWAVTRGVIDGFIRTIGHAPTTWQKTDRFRPEKREVPSSVS